MTSFLKPTLLASVPVISFLMTLFSQATGDPLAGGAGWASFGIAGLVLSWLLLMHLPAKDKQMKELAENVTRERKEEAERYDTERTVERDARHKRMSEFQTMLNTVAATNEKAIQEVNRQHVADAAADREAFLQRQGSLEESFSRSITAQTVALELAIVKATQNICRYVDNDRTKRQKPEETL